MSKPRYFLWLAEQALHFLIFAWPITVILLLFVVGTFMAAYRKRRLTVRNVAWSLFPLVVPLTLLAWGVMFQQTGWDAKFGYTWQASYTWQTVAPTIILFGQIPVVVLAVRRAVDARLFAVAMAAFISHFSFWAAVLAEMSVTGIWPQRHEVAVSSKASSPSCSPIPPPEILFTSAPSLNRLPPSWITH